MQPLDQLYYLRYFLEGSEDYVVVATTRPETYFGDTAVMGKTQGSDISLDKSTYPALLGIDKAKELEKLLSNNKEE